MVVDKTSLLQCALLFSNVVDIYSLSIYLHLSAELKVKQKGKNLIETKQAQIQPKISSKITKNVDNLMQHC